MRQLKKVQGPSVPHPGSVVECILMLSTLKPHNRLIIPIYAERGIWEIETQEDITRHNSIYDKSKEVARGRRDKRNTSSYQMPLTPCTNSRECFVKLQ